jgi:hypothetical protein
LPIEKFVEHGDQEISTIETNYFVAIIVRDGDDVSATEVYARQDSLESSDMFVSTNRSASCAVRFFVQSLSHRARA